MMRTMPVLDVQHLRKTYGPLVAVEDVSFTIEAGQLVGLLGPNGAGTTTPVSMIAGLVTPERGEVRVGGSRLHGDTDPAKRPIGLVPQDLALYDELSGRDNLPFFGALYGLSGRALAGALAAARGVTTLAVLMMVMLGGAWVPTFIFPPWLQQLTLIVPVRWAVDGLDAMTWRGIGAAGAVVPLDGPDRVRRLRGHRHAAVPVGTGIEATFPAGLG
jgi:ABC-type dipeptide/oligopeptide/nickel transport system ATPase component